MQSKAMLAALVFMAGCGGAQVETTHPVSEEAAVTETEAPAAPEPEEEVAQPVVASPTAAPARPRESAIETGERVVNCDWDFPRADVPDEPVHFTSGPLQVRTQSLVLDAYPEADTVIYCVSRAPVPEGARLVFYMGDYDNGAGSWDGHRLANPYTRIIDNEETLGEAAYWTTVTLPGQTVTAAREMAYCPTNPRRSCLAVGDYTQLLALPYGDPNGPRSGWDFTERAVRPVPARAATNVTGVDACGLNVAYRRIADCTATTGVELDACLQSHRMGCIYDGYEGEGARECARGQLVLSDGANEIALPARDARQIACVDHVAIVYDSAVEAASRRSFVAIEQAQGRITQARRMTIVDHEEARSDCMNAWDGVSLAPILGRGALIGAVVRGTGRPTRFDVGRGDVGEATLAPATEEEDVDYGNEPTPRAYHVTSEGLAALEVSTTPTAPPCPLYVVDPDGETNVRPSPSTRRPPVGTIPTGTVIQPVEQRGRWYRIEAPAAGWLFAGSLARRCGR